MDVVRERLERRDIDDLRLVLERVFESLPDQPVDGTKKGGKGLAGAGWRGNQHIASCLDRGPGFALRWRRACETLVKPRPNRGVEKIEWHKRTSGKDERVGQSGRQVGFSLSPFNPSSGPCHLAGARRTSPTANSKGDICGCRRCREPAQSMPLPTGTKEPALEQVKAPRGQPIRL